MTSQTARAETRVGGGMTRGKQSAADKRFGEFARSVRRNLRQVHRIRRILERAEQVARRCYEKAGVAMLDAKASSVMSEEAFAAWLAPFGLSQDDLLQCLELGQVARDRRKAESAEREESFRRIVKERRDQMSPEAVRREEEQWARPSERGQQELRR
jgi:hypothetical protein